MKSRRLVIEPAPEVTLITRGVVLELRRSGANDSSIRAGPVALVRKHVVS